MRHCLTAEKGRKALQLGPRRPTMSQKFDLQAKIQPLCFVKIPNQKLFSYNVLLDRQRQPTQSCFMPRPINCSIVPAFMYPCWKNLFFKLMNKICHLLVHCVLPCLACFEACCLPTACLDSLLLWEKCVWPIYAWGLAHTPQARSTIKNWSGYPKLRVEPSSSTKHRLSVSSLRHYNH